MASVTPGVKTFHSLNALKFEIPQLQRNFVWKDENIDRLIETIKNMVGEEKKFLGSLIHFKVENSEDRFEIIDGQQRSTTFTIFAKALVDVYNIWRELIDDPVKREDVGNENVNVFGHEENLHWHMSNLFTYYCKRSPAGSAKGFLTMKGKDGLRYRWIMEDRRSSGDLVDKKYEFRDKPHGRGTPHIYRAYHQIFKFFAKAMSTINDTDNLLWYDADDEVWKAENDVDIVKRVLKTSLTFIHNAFCRAYFVQLEVNDRKDIYDIFDAVNGTGVKLTEYDLLRNMIAGKIENVQNLSAQQKVAKSKSLGDIVDVNDYKANICQLVMDIIPLCIDGVTKKAEKANFWEEFGARFVDDNSIDEGINELSRWFEIINNLQTIPDQFVEENPRLGSKLQFFSSTSSKFHLPLLIKAKLNGKEYEDLIAIQEVCETLFINHIILDKIYPQEVKNKIVEALDETIEINWEAETVPQIVIKLKLRWQTTRDDVELELKAHNEYKSGQSKFLLWNINQNLLSKENIRLAALPVPQEIEPEPYEKDWTLEHILPQKAKADGWTEDYKFGSELHTNNLNKLGNHTLYKSYQNKKMGNKSRDFKFEGLPYPEGVHPGMRLNRNIFTGIVAWTEDEIDNRSSILADEIKEIWYG
ncbi:DUF262 domain-containing HNH endonuclease family protein [Candidatus Poseidoniaceae archaeon]|nr:DUF262 domain-containing HNH endonuclease family protein [Candidatus Poseidoniaceae archaeon]